MKELIIVAIVYHEPEWQETKKCIEATGLPVYYVERRPRGSGSLAETINRGFMEAKAINYKFTWFVTNVTFTPLCPTQLLAAFDLDDNMAVVHPHFNSDHPHLHKKEDSVCHIVPFVEFTCAMVRSIIFSSQPLDEDMPYWGHDPDHGLRMWRSGHTVAVSDIATIGHVYIRNNKKGHAITRQRLHRRRLQDQPTKNALRKKYGDDWRWMFPRDAVAEYNYWKRLNNM